VITANDFHINETKIAFKKDEYQLSKIKDARIKTNTLKDHAARVVTISLIVASVVWTICPEYIGIYTAPVALIIGMLLALATTRKYELQIESQHNDDTGLQWISIAKANKQSVKSIFEQQVINIQKSIT